MEGKRIREMTGNKSRMAEKIHKEKYTKRKYT